jgi:hypothetical protein
VNVPLVKERLIGLGFQLIRQDFYRRGGEAQRDAKSSLLFINGSFAPTCHPAKITALDDGTFGR